MHTLVLNFSFIELSVNQKKASFTSKKGFKNCPFFSRFKSNCTFDKYFTFSFKRIASLEVLTFYLIDCSVLGPDLQFRTISHWCNSVAFNAFLLIDTGVSEGRISLLRPEVHRMKADFEIKRKLMKRS